MAVGYPPLRAATPHCTRVATAATTRPTTCDRLVLPDSPDIRRHVEPTLLDHVASDRQSADRRPEHHLSRQTHSGHATGGHWYATLPALEPPQAKEECRRNHPNGKHPRCDSQRPRHDGDGSVTG